MLWDWQYSDKVALYVRSLKVELFNDIFVPNGYERILQI